MNIPLRPFYYTTTRNGYKSLAAAPPKYFVSYFVEHPTSKE